MPAPKVAQGPSPGPQPPQAIAPPDDAPAAARHGPNSAPHQPPSRAAQPPGAPVGAKHQTRTPRPRPSRATKRVPLGKARKPDARSRVTNGHDILPNVDNRSQVARRYFDISSAIIADQGGLDRLAEARLQLVRRFAAAAVMAEQMEAALARGETIDISQHALLVSSLCRLSNRIGINRRAREVLTTLEGYLEARAEEAEADE